MTIDVGGVAGGTQFVILTPSVDTEIVDTGGCPCETGYQLTDDNLASVTVDAGYNLNDTVADQGYGDDTGSVQAVVPVSTGGSHTFHVVAFASGGTGTVYAQAQITAMTTPYGSTGANTLGATSAGGAHRPIPDFSHPGK